MITPSVWNLFHDGVIVSIFGKVPGDLDVLIELEYIRSQFPDAGNAFNIHITACALLSFEPFDGKGTIFDVEAIACRNLEILSAKLDDSILRVITPCGTLRLQYRAESLSLDSGRLLSFSDIAEAADRAVAKYKPGISGA